MTDTKSISKEDVQWLKSKLVYGYRNVIDFEKKQVRVYND